MAESVLRVSHHYLHGSFLVEDAVTVKISLTFVTKGILEPTEWFSVLTPASLRASTKFWTNDWYLNDFFYSVSYQIKNKMKVGEQNFLSFSENPKLQTSFVNHILP